jgi:hypothetical protein
VSGPNDYLDLALDGSDGTVSPDPLVIVCAHGRHDQCCAVRGRGAAREIVAAYPELTWECSHLGGDRFAATMLILPEALCYGRVDQTDAAELVRLYLDGRLDNRFLRGRASLPHVVQAAQYFAREAVGDDHVTGWCSATATAPSRCASPRSSPSRCSHSATPVCPAGFASSNSCRLPRSLR